MIDVLIALAITVAFLYFLLGRCTCGNHIYELVEEDKTDRGFDKYKCIRCGHNHTNNSYSGIGG